MYVCMYVYTLYICVCFIFICIRWSDTLFMHMHMCIIYVYTPHLSTVNHDFNVVSADLFPRCIHFDLRYLQDKPNYQHFRRSFTKALTDVGLEVRSWEIQMDQRIQGLIKSDKTEVCWNKSGSDPTIYGHFTSENDENPLGLSLRPQFWTCRLVLGRNLEPHAYLSISVWTIQFFGYPILSPQPFWFSIAIWRICIGHL